MEPVPALGLQGVDAELLPRRGAVHLGGDSEALREERPRGHRLLEDRTRTHEPDSRLRAARDVRCGQDPVDPAHDPLRGAFGRGRHWIDLVVERDVVVDVLATPVHALDAVADDRGQLVRVGRVVGADAGDRRREELAVPVLVLEALAVQAGPAGRRAKHEAAPTRVGQRPGLVAGPLEPEHRVEDVEGQHRLTVRRVGRGGCLEGRHRARFGDPLLQHLAILRLAIGEDQLRVNRLVVLALAGIDPDLLEERIQAKRARLVGDDRDHPLAEPRVAHEVPEELREDHRGADGGRRAGGELPVGLRSGSRQRPAADDTLRECTAQRTPALHEVTHLLGVGAWVVVRRLGELLVRDRELQAIAEDPQLRLGELLRLVGDVAPFHAGAKRPALDRLGQDHRGRTLELGGQLVGRVELAVVVTAPAEAGQVVVGEVLHQPAEARVGAEEVLTDVGPAGHGVLLELAIDGLVHLVDERPVRVPGQQVVPLAAPDHLDDVPAGAAEDPLQLLDYLAVAADRPVQPLQVAVDDEGQVVEPLAAGDPQRTQRLRLVHLAVAQEGPDARAAGVRDAAMEQVPVEARLVDGRDGTQAHAHGRELPEVGHQARVRVRREALPGAHFATEVVQLGGTQPPLQERPGVDPRRRVPLVEDLVAGALVLAAEEPVERDLVQARGAGVRGEVTADPGRDAVGAQDHRHRVPADQAPDTALDRLVAGEVRLLLRADRVDVTGLRQRRQPDVELAGPLQELVHDEAGAIGALLVHQVVERGDPVVGLARIDIRQLVLELVRVHGGHSWRGTRVGLRQTPGGRPRAPRGAPGGSK